MARVARRRHRLEFAVRGTLVARVTVNCRMRSGQWEAVVVLLHIFYRHLPATHGVALLAIRAQLPLMNVRVAVLAALAYIGEHRLHVALRTSNGLVHASQGIARLIVIEFRNCANGLPSRRRMAVLTRCIEIAVRTVRTRNLRLRVSG